MKKTIFFLSPFLITESVAKSKLYWNHSLWGEYNTVYIRSKLPKSDNMVKKELNRLNNLINLFPNVILIGNSLGAWWAGNLACQPSNIKAVVLIDTIINDDYNVLINATQKYSIMHRIPYISGPTKILACATQSHSCVHRHFNAIPYLLDNGFFRAKNYESCLNFTKDWIEVI